MRACAKDRRHQETKKKRMRAIEKNEMYTDNLEQKGRRRKEKKKKNGRL